MTEPRPRGPDGYENWRALLAGSPARGASEVNLYTDAEITGHVPDPQSCPYAFLNALAFRRRDLLAPAIVLRAESHIDGEVPSMEQTDTSRYHGGTFVDEIAVLASLALGIRVHAGGLTRTFEPGDPAGSPRADSNIPVLPPPQYPNAPLIPHAKLPKNLNNDLMPRLSIYPQLPANHAVTLVRAARLYRDALWVVESEPQLAWLFLVAALDTVASSLVKRRGATARFIDFTLKYLPSPPLSRPPPQLQVGWDRDAMGKALAKIYDYRSRALHDGAPFPPPMSQPESIFTEVPTGLASATLGGVWMRGDMPMLIHVFEHIVRGAITNWWTAVPTAG